MTSTQRDVLAESVRQEIQSLTEAGWQAYQSEQVLQAVELFGRALELAESIGDTRAISECRFSLGESLSATGHKRRALSVLAPILQESLFEDEVDSYYSALTKYIEIAQVIPVSLRSIEKAYTQTERFLRSVSRTDWQHKLLLLRAILAYRRGMNDTALATAQEAWTRWKGDYPSYTADAHLNLLVYLSLRVGNAAQTRRYLDEWERYPDPNLWRQWASGCGHSKLARLEQRPHDAVDWARRAVLAAEQSDRVVFDQLSDLIRALILSEDCRRAREPLVRALALRCSECGHDRYKVHLLNGDYYLACAREAAGIFPVDDQFGQEFPSPQRVADPSTTHQEIVRARRAYATALRVGQDIDEKLECTVRQHEIAERLARVEAIAQHI